MTYSGTASGRRSRHLGRSQRERGAVLVEFALVAPVLFALLLGTFTGGMALSRKNSVINANREGARLGATLPASTTWADTTRDRVIAISGGDLTTAQVCVRLRTVTGASTSTVVHQTASCAFTGEPSLPSGSTVGDCIVTVWSQRTTPFEVLFFSRTITLRASAVSLYERGRGAACNQVT